MTDINKLNEVLDAIVQDRTFSLEAVEAINSLRDANNGLEEQVKEKNLAITGMKDANDRLSKENANINNDLRLYKEAEDNLKKREAKITELEKTAAVEKATASALGHCFDTVFKNTVFREQFNKQLARKEYGGPESGDFKRTTEPEL